MIDGLEWDLISLQLQHWLKRPFEEMKIRDAIFAMDREKAPGQNEFTMAFFSRIVGDNQRSFRVFLQIFIGKEIFDLAEL